MPNVLNSPYKPVVLMILDGFGYTQEKQGNAILNANLPYFQELNMSYPKAFLQASGISVGLPWMQYGNSEVGHQTIGTGQISFQDLPRISSSIKNGTFFKNDVLLGAIKQAKEKGANLHLMGLLSDGGVHSHIDHFLALLELIEKEKLGDRTFIHAFIDGRDAPPASAENYIKQILHTKIGQIASMSGRYYAMDRNNNWDRIQKAYVAISRGDGNKETDPFEALKKQYARNITDEYFEPVVFLDNNGNPLGTFKENDVLIFLNYRKDRARQLTEVFLNPNFDKFPKSHPSSLLFVSMTQYAEEFKNEIAFPPQQIKCRISEVLSQQGFKQLKIAETEKYAHVTYFFNGGVEQPYPGEDQILIPSKNVSSYAQLPEMSALEVTDRIIQEIDKNIYDFILVNYANPDMVGHTGDLYAGIRCLEYINNCVQRVNNKVLEKNGCVLISADHGNIEEMINLKTGEKDTQHSNNPVPCWLVAPNNKKTDSTALDFNSIGVQGMLVDIAPTIMNLLNIPSQINNFIGIDLRQVMK